MKKHEEVAEALSCFHPLLHCTSLLFVRGCAHSHSHNSLLKLLEDAVREEYEVLSSRCPSTFHLRLRRALVF